MNRPLLEQEKNWLIRGLKMLGTGEHFGGGNWIDTETNERKPLDKPVNPDNLSSQIDDLRVIEKCDCGDSTCHTVKFQHFERNKSVAIVCSHTEDKRMLIIHVHENTEMLSELEII